MLEITSQKNHSASIKAVDFLIGGVQKAGTTALHDSLKTHPQLNMSRTKELHFFDNDKYFGNPQPLYQQYHSKFDIKVSESLAGEATPSYLFFPKVAPRVKQYNPKMKWIIILRQPVLRAYSHWNMQRTRGIENLDFIDALNAEEQRMQNLSLDTLHRFAYAGRSRYENQINNLLRFFPKKQCLFLKSEELNSKTENILNPVTDFLGVLPNHIKSCQSHLGSYQDTLNPQTLQSITHIFSQDIERTARVTGLDLQDWL